MSFGSGLMKGDEKLIDVNVCVIGQHGSGKSYLIQAFMKNSSGSEWKQQQYHHEKVIQKDIITVDHSNSQFIIKECEDLREIGTYGGLDNEQEQKKELESQKCSVIVVCDLADLILKPQETQQFIQKLLQDVKKNPYVIAMILVGAKNDIIKYSQHQYYVENMYQQYYPSQRQTYPQYLTQNPSQILKRLADINGASSYIETSAVNNINVALAFELASGHLQTQMFMTSIQQQQISRWESREQGRIQGGRKDIQLSIKKKQWQNGVNCSEEEDNDTSGITYYSTCW